MQVSSEGSFRELPLADQAKIVAALPFVAVAVVAIAAVQLISNAATGVMEFIHR